MGMAEMLCKKCGGRKSSSEFYKRNDEVDTTWCKQCYKKWHRERYKPRSGYTDEKRECQNCQSIYVPKARQKSFFCSRKCKDESRQLKNKMQLLSLKSNRICIGCGKTIGKTSRADKKWCSEDCASKARGHTMNATRRIQTNEPMGTFLRLDIYNRDKWICQICKKPVDKELSFPNPSCASLDHILPLSRGGTHESINVQLAHLSCNTSKGNRVGEVNTRPALLRRGKRVFTIPEAAKIAGVSPSALQHAVALERVRCEPRKKFESRYLSAEVVAEILEIGIPGSRVWVRQNRIDAGPRVRTVKCKQCGEKKAVEISLHSPRSYCSRVCYQTSLRNRKKLDPTRLLRIQCSVCKRSIKGRKQVKRVNLCSNKCINTWRRQGRGAS